MSATAARTTHDLHNSGVVIIYNHYIYISSSSMLILQSMFARTHEPFRVALSTLRQPELHRRTAAVTSRQLHSIYCTLPGSACASASPRRKERKPKRAKIDNNEGTRLPFESTDYDFVSRTCFVCGVPLCKARVWRGHSPLHPRALGALLQSANPLHARPPGAELSQLAEPTQQAARYGTMPMPAQ